MNINLFLALLLALLALFGLPGCETLNPKPPVEAFAEKLADQAIIPAVREGLARGTQNLGIQAGAHAINPTYVVKFSGKWVTGVEGEASVGVEGVAGQLQIASAAGGERLPIDTRPTPGEPSAPPGEARSTQNGPLAASEGRLPETIDARPPGVPVYVMEPVSPPEPVEESVTLSVTVLDIDRDEDKGFSRLEDGTLVVIAGAADRLGQEVVIVPLGRRGGVLDATLAGE
ncbi:MAG: hypothetical protein IPM13_10295 [Phycisphaerales bacterium]|nr:hypothetical protein [Phycisphaerales bacterium]